MPDRDALGEAGTTVMLRFIGTYDDPRDPFSRELARELGNAHRRLGILSAGHRYNRVVQNLVRDVDPRCHARLQRQLAGMEEGAVTHVLENVRDIAKACLADPLSAFTAHLGERSNLARCPRLDRHHGVAADAAPRQRSLWHDG